MKIRQKTYLTFLSLGIFLTIIGVGVYFFFFYQNFQKVVLENINNLIQIKEKNINLVIENRLSQQGIFTSIDEINKNIEEIDQGILYQEYSKIVDNNYQIDEIMLVDKNGISRFSTNPANFGKIFSTQEFKDLYSLDTAVVGEIMKDDFGYFNYFSYPTKNKNNYLFIRYNLEPILQMVNDNEILGNSGEFLLAIQNGAEIEIVNDRKFNVFLGISDAADYPMREALEKKRGTFLNTLDYRNVPVVASYLYLDKLGAGLVVKEDRSEAFSFVGEMILVSIMLGIAIILFVYLTTNVLSRRLTRPIEELNKAVEIVSKGNWDYQIDISGDDEISEVAKSFHKMAQAIKNAKEKTDKQIEEQTKNLRDQQMAILNILEDVEAEKEKVANSAKELEKFKQAVENTSDHVVITDENGIIIYANKAVEKITGFSREEVLGTKVGTKANWGGIMGKDFYDNMWHTIKDEKKSFSGYLKNVRKNGEEYEALANISPVFDAGGNVIFFVGIERDFTREREIDRAKSEFVSLASHQLRTPLSTVNWYSEILLSEDAGKINEEQREYLQEIYKGNQRMVNLVNALLNVSRIDLGTLSIDPEPTNLIDLAESVLKELELKIKERKHKIVRNFDKEIPDINLDPKMMRIVWQNYLTNAVKYTAEGGTIEINIKKKKTLVEISVKDDGMGIPKAQQEKIFEKLFRADNAREKETDGTGLGLYIVKSIIEEFGGKVWFKSKKNKGSTFYATIPLKGIKAKEGTKGLEYID